MSKAQAVKRVGRPPRLARRSRDGHKGDYGHVLVIGGSRGMPGAVAMACNAALRGGAGLATFAAPSAVQLAIAGLCPCATSVPLECDAAGAPARGAARRVMRVAGGCDVLAAGPGMGVGLGQAMIVRAVLEQADKPVVLDADGLNNLAQMDDWAEIRRCPLVLTPHPGEFSRLTRKKTADIQADRAGSAVTAARKWTDGASASIPAGHGAAATARPELVLVLKGAGTIVTDGRRVYVNATGNPGMATGGSGDILTGVIAALIGQGLSPFDAACLGVHVHGRAGDLGAARLGEVSLTAWDLLDYLPGAFRAIVR
jgi:ADP-dependent NAD(P)H-hydrate dehydratase